MFVTPFSELFNDVMLNKAEDFISRLRMSTGKPCSQPMHIHSHTH